MALSIAWSLSMTLWALGLIACLPLAASIYNRDGLATRQWLAFIAGTIIAQAFALLWVVKLIH